MHDVFLSLFKWPMHSEHSVKYFEENYSGKVFEKDLVRKALSTTQIVQEILLYMKSVTDLRL